jgi:hypothetical protein
MEDGLPLGPNNAWWYGGDIIARDGRFGWRRDETQIIFATPDNSDPRTNGRAYKLVYTNEADAKWRDVPAFEETLSPADFVRLESGWMYRPKHPLPARPSVYPERAAEMQQWRACLARMTLRENDRPLEALPAFGDPRAISKVWKKGAWQIWDGVLLFTTPDNSAPPENGRAYKFVYTAEAAR